MKKGHIFDLDGTLLDSLWIWRKIDDVFLGKRGVHPIPQDYYREIALMEGLQAAVYTKERFSLTETVDEILEEWFDMAKLAYERDILLKPYAMRYLKTLKEKGCLLGVATSGDESLFLPALRRLEILPFFDTIVTSKEIGKKKGTPDIYLRAAKNLGLSPRDCVVYEDIFQAVCGAKEGDFYTVAVYNKDGEKEWEDVRKKADRSIFSYEELL